MTISSPYARRGYLWATFQKHYGPDGSPSILVAQAATEVKNPSVDQTWIAAQFEDDPIATEAEYNAQFRSDAEAFIDRDIVESCVERDCFEIPPNDYAY